ncbi:helix-turn-helix transcriptional regulator [uncultured Eubacterium sp.]|uniref:helix-turn-helix domain-containing protein n=1 Tax=uncultured Eubacterium sp. TaxID=165185 RepID=UPI0025E28B98|nr:helix-turn-helix transcriptional regulator [uncultured Eubacterium sp.]
MTLGEKLYTLRTKQNMTQEQLAEKLQVSRQSISKWESDATRPDLEKLKFLAEFYHLSLDKLLDEDVDIFAKETSSDLSQDSDYDSNHRNGADASANSAFVNNQSDDADHHDNSSALGVSLETIEKITSEILQKNHKTWKRTFIGFGTACLALTVALIIVTITFSTKLNALSTQIAQSSAPVYINNDSDYTTERDTYFQSYNATADSVTEDGKNLHVKFTAVLKNYQDNTTLTMQLLNNSDQSNIPVTFTYEDGTYTGFADLPISADTYTTTACIDTNGSKQTVDMYDEYSSFSVLSLADWQPGLEVDGNSYDKLNRRNDGQFNLNCSKLNCRSFISDVTLEILANDTKVYSYSLDDEDMNILSEEGTTLYIPYSFTLSKDNTAETCTVRLHWYNSIIKQYITYEVDGVGLTFFNVTNSDIITSILFNPDLDSDDGAAPVKVTFSSTEP